MPAGLLLSPYIYPSLHTYAHLDLIVWLNSLWIRGLTLQYMFCKYALSCTYHFYELHISLSEKRRHNIIHCLGEDPQIPHIWETWECHTMESLSFILETYKNSKIMVEWRSLRHSAWLDRSVFQLLKIQMKAQKPHGWR
jgi:hypothetical protein